MESIQDALYNWMTIKVVCDARPDDTAALDTLAFFEKLLVEKEVIIQSLFKEEPFYFIEYLFKNEVKKQRFPIEVIDVMLNQIKAEPEKYRNLE